AAKARSPSGRAPLPMEPPRSAEARSLAERTPFVEAAPRRPRSIPGGSRAPGPAPTYSGPAASSRLHEVDDRRLVRGRHRDESVARRGGFPAVEPDRLVHAVSAPVVEQEELAVQEFPRDAHPPERRRPPFRAVGVAVRAVVGKTGTEIVKQEIRVDRDIAIGERFNLVR